MKDNKKMTVKKDQVRAIIVEKLIRNIFNLDNFLIKENSEKYTVPSLPNGYYDLAQKLNQMPGFEKITTRTLRNLYQDKFLKVGDQLDLDDIRNKLGGQNVTPKIYNKSGKDVFTLRKEISEYLPNAGSNNTGSSNIALSNKTNQLVKTAQKMTNPTQISIGRKVRSKKTDSDASKKNPQSDSQAISASVGDDQPFSFPPTTENKTSSSASQITPEENAALDALTSAPRTPPKKGSDKNPAPAAVKNDTPVAASDEEVEAAKKLKEYEEIKKLYKSLKDDQDSSGGKLTKENRREIIKRIRAWVKKVKDEENIGTIDQFKNYFKRAAMNLYDEENLSNADLDKFETNSGSSYDFEEILDVDNYDKLDDKDKFSKLVAAYNNKKDLSPEQLENMKKEMTKIMSKNETWGNWFKRVTDGKDLDLGLDSSTTSAPSTSSTSSTSFSTASSSKPASDAEELSIKGNFPPATFDPKKKTFKRIKINGTGVIPKRDKENVGVEGFRNNTMTFMFLKNSGKDTVPTIGGTYSDEPVDIETGALNLIGFPNYWKNVNANTNPNDLLKELKENWSIKTLRDGKNIYYNAEEDKDWNKIAKDFESFIQKHKRKKMLEYITNHKHCTPCVWLSGPELYNFVKSTAYTKFPIFAIDVGEEVENFEEDFKKILSKYTVDQIIDGTTPQFVCVSISDSGKIKLEVKIEPTQSLGNSSINKANLFGEWKDGISLKSDPYIATSGQRKVFFENMKKAFQ